MPASVLVHIQNGVRINKHTGQYVSVTSLLGCLRQLFYERTLEYFVEPPKSWWSLRGAILHRILEQPGIEALLEDLKKEVYRQIRGLTVDRDKLEQLWIEVEVKALEIAALLPRQAIPNWKSEVEYEYFIGSYDGEDRYLRGTIDVLREETGEIYDYKTIGDRGLSIIKDGAKKDHVMQFNMYRLLVERGWPVGERNTYKPIKINKITAFYMTMMQIARTGGVLVENTDWRVSEPSGHPNMAGEPEVLGVKESLKMKKGKRLINAQLDDYELQTYKKFRLSYAVPEVQLLDLDDVAKFIKDTAPILFDAFQHGAVPIMCSPEMRQWKCESYCPDQIREACDAHNAKTGEKRIVEVETGIPVEAM